MKKLILILMLGMVFGQDIDETLLNNTEKMILYHAERKNPSTAVIFEGFFSLQLVMHIQANGRKDYFIDLFHLE